MKVLLFGASGMVGQGVLIECLRDPRVESLLCVGRSPLGIQHPKVRELVVPDLYRPESVAQELTGWDAAFFCLGVSSAGMSEAQYTHITHDLTLAVAATVARQNPGLTFTYISGSGTDSTERGRAMWARVKGRTENALFALPFKAAYMFRPGLIRPMHGVRSKTSGYRWTYLLLAPFLPIVQALAPHHITTTERVGRAMLQVAEVGDPAHLLYARDINRLAAAHG